MNPFKYDYRFTDAFGPLIPTLAEPLSTSSSNDHILVEARPFPCQQDDTCDVCDSKEMIGLEYAPCVLRSKRGPLSELTIWPDYYHAPSPTDRLATQAFCTLELALCPRCSNRLRILAGRQDHLAIGYDYWDIVDAAVQHLSGDRWTKHSISKIRTAHNITMMVIKKSHTQDDGAFSTLNADVIGLIGAELEQSAKKSCVSSIETLWLRNSRRCEDCGMHRAPRNLIEMPATDIDPRGWHRNDIVKNVCVDACCYYCQHCSAHIDIPYEEMRILEDVGLRTAYCALCGETTEVDITWY